LGGSFFPIIEGGAAMTLGATELRRLTRRYWDRGGTKRYIEELLPEELKFARERGAIEEHPCDTLALLVGYSVEPLLQAVCAFQPDERLVLVLNEWYGSQDDPNRQRGLKRGGNLEEVIKVLPPKLLPKQPVIESREVTDEPTSVFRRLCQYVLPDQQAGKQVIVDITGAKKSMDAGAFLFAAYADIPVSYINFDDYDEEKRRPYGFTCRIGTLDNPYELFRLRDWEQVRQLYDGYSFRAASELLEGRDKDGLKGLIGFMTRPLEDKGMPLFDENGPEVAVARQLARALEMYESWDNGDYHKAKQLASKLSIPSEGIPWAVEVLGEGNLWPHIERCSRGDANAQATRLLLMHLALKRGDPSPRSSLFAQPEPLLAYARDELAKIKRLLSPVEDYRSTYLRAAGLHEFLLKARVAICWLRDELDITMKNRGPLRPSSFTEAEQKGLFFQIVEHDGADQMRKMLFKPTITSLSLRRYKDPATGKGVGARAAMPSSVPALDNYWSGKALDLDGIINEGRPIFVRLRGEAIHTHLFVTQDVAKAAYDLAGASLDEFERNWLPRLTGGLILQYDVKRLEAPEWDKLCKWCGLTFLPLFHQRQETPDEQDRREIHEMATGR
jgi:hypothetical protein